MFRDIMALAERVSSMKVENPDFGEDDLYDENGLPA
jgi:hypothetical protein